MFVSTHGKCLESKQHGNKVIGFSISYVRELPTTLRPDLFQSKRQHAPDYIIINYVLTHKFPVGYYLLKLFLQSCPNSL